MKLIITDDPKVYKLWLYEKRMLNAIQSIVYLLVVYIKVLVLIMKDLDKLELSSSDPEDW